MIYGEDQLNYKNLNKIKGDIRDIDLLEKIVPDTFFNSFSLYFK